MSVLCTEQRARRRRLEAGLLTGLVLTFTALGATAYIAKLTAVLMDAETILASPRLGAARADASVKPIHG
jgi:hypothetical protein